MHHTVNLYKLFLYSRERHIIIRYVVVAGITTIVITFYVLCIDLFTNTIITIMEYYHHPKEQPLVNDDKKKLPIKNIIGSGLKRMTLHYYV